jgi:hypothetical protein
MGRAHRLGMRPLRTWLTSDHGGRTGEGVVGRCAGGGAAIVVSSDLEPLVASGYGSGRANLDGMVLDLVCVLQVSLVGARSQCFSGSWTWSRSLRCNKREGTVNLDQADVFVRLGYLV